MRTLDRYVTALVLKIFFLGLAAFFGLFTVIDIFRRAHQLVDETGATAWLRLGLYYAYSLPGLFNLAAPLVFSLSCIFALARLQKKSELVAIMAGGISLHRLTRVLRALALALGIAIFLCQEFVITKVTLRQILVEEPNFFARHGNLHISFRDQLAFAGHPFPDVLVFSRGYDLIDIEEMNVGSGRIEGFHATLLDDQARPRAKLYADSGSWRKSGNIELNNCFVRSYVNPFPNDISHWNLKSLSAKIGIPLKAALYAGLSPEGANILELRHFTAESVRDYNLYAEYIFRYIQPFYPLIMLIASLSLGLPWLGRHPAVAYFLALASGATIFAVGAYLKQALASGNATPDLAVISILSIAVFSYIWGKLRIVT